MPKEAYAARETARLAEVAALETLRALSLVIVETATRKLERS